MSDISDMTVGQSVTFTSKNTNDNVQYSGKIKGMVDYTIAKQFSDVRSYHAAVKKADSSICEVELATFFIIILKEATDGKPKTRAFAQEWITDGSFFILDEASAVSIKIYGMEDSSVIDLLSSLKAQGYIAVQE